MTCSAVGARVQRVYQLVAPLTSASCKARRHSRYTFSSSTPRRHCPSSLSAVLSARSSLRSRSGHQAERRWSRILGLHPLPGLVTGSRNRQCVYEVVGAVGADYVYRGVSRIFLLARQGKTRDDWWRGWSYRLGTERADEYQEKATLHTRHFFAQAGPATLCNGLSHRSLKVSDSLGLYSEIWAYTVADISGLVPGLEENFYFVHCMGFVPMVWICSSHAC